MCIFDSTAPCTSRRISLLIGYWKNYTSHLASYFHIVTNCTIRDIRTQLIICSPNNLDHFGLILQSTCPEAVLRQSCSYVSKTCCSLQKGPLLIFLKQTFLVPSLNTDDIVRNGKFQNKSDLKSKRTSQNDETRWYFGTYKTCFRYQML
jgi:hypothetical protein